jgi:ankyrin repeat protein
MLKTKSLLFLFALFNPVLAMASDLHIGAKNCDIYTLNNALSQIVSNVENRATISSRKVSRRSAKKSPLENPHGKWDWKAMHYAARNECTRAIEILKAHGANVNALDGGNWTPLHVAAFYGKLNSASYLLRNGAKPRLLNNDGDTPSEIARKRGFHEIQYLIALWP